MARLKVLKDSDITRALLNEIKQKFISEKKREVPRETSKITDLVLVRSSDEKDRIVHLLESANIQCHVDEDSFKSSSNPHSGTSGANLNSAPGTGDDRELLQHRVVLTRDWKKCSLPHFRTFLIEFDFSLKTFMTLLKNDAKKLFIFLNKQVFREMKLRKLKEIINPFFFLNLLKLNTGSLAKVPMHFSASSVFSCKLKKLNTDKVRAYIKKLLLQFKSIERQVEQEVGKKEQLLRKIQRVLKKKILHLLHPQALLSIWDKLEHGLGCLSFASEKQKPHDSIVKFLIARGVISVRSVYKTIAFNLEVQDKAQFKKYITEHPSLKFILESNVANPDSHASCFDAFIQRSLGETLEKQPGTPSKSLHNSRVVRKKLFPEDSRKSKGGRNYSDLLTEMNRPLGDHRVKQAGTGMVQSLVGMVPFFNIFGKKKLGFEFVKVIGKPLKKIHPNSNRVFQDDILVNQEFLEHSASPQMRGSCKFNQKLREMCQNDEELIECVSNIFEKKLGDSGKVIRDNKLEYLQSHLANLKKRKIISLAKSEKFVYLFDRNQEFLNCLAQILKEDFVGMRFEKELDMLERASEVALSKSFVFSKNSSKSTHFYFLLSQVLKTMTV